jgi:hypothetical protein
MTVCAEETTLLFMVYFLTVGYLAYKLREVPEQKPIKKKKKIF